MTENKDGNPYGSLVIGCIPKLMSMVDRNPFSSTFGCGDRAYWHYRTMTDYAAPIHQEIVLSLAITLSHPSADNTYRNSPELKAVVEAALDFWLQLQQRDGSFAEFYPGERSFVATAFTACAVSETLVRLQGRIDESLRARLLSGLARAADWLHGHRDVVVVNHTAGAIALLNNLSVLTGDKRFARYREDKIGDLLAHQHAEGWFYEYGGADLSYLSLAVDYLALDYHRSRDERLRISLDKALNFMCFFIHPDGSFGGEYGSRNAKYLLPHGIELLAAESEDAALLARYCRRRQRCGLGVSPAAMDDRYTAFFLNKYAGAWADAGPLPSVDEERLNWKGNLVFPGAGLAIRKDETSYSVIGISKHGVVKRYMHGEGAVKRYSDTGYFAVFADGTVGVTQWLDLGAENQIDTGDEQMKIRVRGKMTLYNTSLPLVHFLVPFRIFLKVFAGWSSFMDWFGRKVIKRMIVDQRQLPVEFERSLTLGDDRLEIVDHLRLEPGVKVLRLGRTPCATSIHVASSRYWQKEDLDVEGSWQATPSMIEELNRGETLEIITRISEDGEMVDSKPRGERGAEVCAA
jgi:hypothetical protein